jgi:hypothetical protein
MAAERRIRWGVGTFAGLVLVVLGVLLFLENLDIAEADEVLAWWPLVLVAVGIVKATGAWGTPKSPWTGGILVGIGGLLLLDEIPGLGIDVDLSDLWPLILVFAGVSLLAGAFRRRAVAPGEAPEAPATLHSFAFMAGNRATSHSLGFVGGEAIAVMGGCEVDLRGASPVPGGAVVDALAFWGGVDLFVPPGWTVESRVVPLLGAFEDKTQPPAVPTGERLVVRGFAIMGGIAVSHGPKAKSS